MLEKSTKRKIRSLNVRPKKFFLDYVYFYSFYLAFFKMYRNSSSKHSFFIYRADITEYASEIVRKVCYAFYMRSEHSDHVPHILIQLVRSNK